MTDVSIPVDPTNPGQVFACLGLMEAAEILCGQVAGHFDLTLGQERFVLSGNNQTDPITEVLSFLCTATLFAGTQDGDNLNVSKKECYSGLTVYPDGSYPSDGTNGHDRVPAVLVRGKDQIILDHWARGFTSWNNACLGDQLKFWAGSGVGVRLTRDALKLLPSEPTDLRDDPFSFAVPQSSSFRFDWRRDYVPIDAGFSPNRHGSISMVGYPVVELLAAIGLRHARPARETRLCYNYSIWATPLPLPFARAMLGQLEPLLPGMAIRTFRMTMSWPGQEGQAKCITRVDEETTQ